MNPFVRLGALVLASALAIPAAAQVVYKEVAADGSILLTDTPAVGLAGDAFERANAKVDLAEHALAVARNPMGSVSYRMPMRDVRLSQGDHQRAAFYMKDVLLARTQLLKARQEIQSPSPRLEQVALR
jgi:DNA primase